MQRNRKPQLIMKIKIQSKLTQMIELVDKNIKVIIMTVVHMLKKLEVN